MERDFFDKIFYGEDEKFFECGKYTVEELTYIYNLNEPKILIIFKDFLKVCAAIVLMIFCIIMFLDIITPIRTEPIMTEPIGNSQYETVEPTVDVPPIQEEIPVVDVIPDTDYYDPSFENIDNNNMLNNSNSSIFDLISIPIKLIIDIVPELVDILIEIADYIDFDKLFYDIENIKKILENPLSDESREIIAEYRIKIKDRIVEQVSNNPNINDVEKENIINRINNAFNRRDKIENHIYDIINRENIVY